MLFNSLLIVNLIINIVFMIMLIIHLVGDHNKKALWKNPKWVERKNKKAEKRLAKLQKKVEGVQVYSQVGSETKVTDVKESEGK